jgi:hypothetical protein
MGARTLGRDGVVEAGDRRFRVETEEPRVGTNESADVDWSADRGPFLVLDGVQVHRTDVNLFGDIRER